jgi:uncharacterized glyoxalase superfamily protein PhnB
MLKNRSIPSSTVIPVLAYEDVGEAAKWLCEAFGFTERLRIGNHRIQLSVGDGAVVVTEGGGSGSLGAGHSVMVRVEDVNRHCEQARQRGAKILNPPTDHPYGERQYTAENLGGHRWTFSQSIADVAPEDWGGVPVNLGNYTEERRTLLPDWDASTLIEKAKELQKLRESGT